MASLSEVKNKNGSSWRFQFLSPATGKREQIRFQRTDDNEYIALKWKINLTKLEDSFKYGEVPPQDILDWLNSLNGSIKEKMVRHGFIS